MKSKKYLFFVITVFVLSIAGLFLSVYYIFIAEKINTPVFYIGSIIDVLIIIFLTWYLYKSREKDQDQHLS